MNAEWGYCLPSIVSSLKLLNGFRTNLELRVNTTSMTDEFSFDIGPKQTTLYTMMKSDFLDIFKNDPQYKQLPHDKSIDLISIYNCRLELSFLL